MMEFDLFKSTVLNATVYADKALYVHTMMVREICLVIHLRLSSIIPLTFQQSIRAA